MRARIIAFYLPQFHPIPENDEWWETGFTEWTNVAKAKPLFRGHKQPKLPSDLGFYDLRVPEVRVAQADLARAHGVEAFCYWHYWFGDGRRLLERPFSEVLASGEPDFPFCLAWANQTWTGVWHGAPDRILIEQRYPGRADHEAHFDAILPALEDRRYLRIDGKPVIVIFRPTELPQPEVFAECWRRLAERAGLRGIHLLGIFDLQRVVDTGWLDGVILQPPLYTLNTGRWSRRLRRLGWRGGVRTTEYRQFVRHFAHEGPLPPKFYPTVVPNWDNTPRSGRNGYILTNSTPSLFGEHLENAIHALDQRAPEGRLVFVKSWNEWAEGNVLEPSREWGRRYLEVVRATNCRER